MRHRILSLLCACLLVFALCPTAFAQELEPSETPELTQPQETQTPNEEQETESPENTEDITPSTEPTPTPSPDTEKLSDTDETEGEGTPEPTTDPNQPPADATDDGCNTAEELYDFLCSTAGGSITLTGDIVWDNAAGLDSISNIPQPVTVEMGEYKIIVPAGCSMYIEGPVTFRGQGSVLFDVQGSLNLSYGVQVLSSGTEAFALDIGGTSSVSLTYCRVAATGANATAIRSALPVQTGAVTIQLCDISGTAASIQAPSVTLDATTASPMPEGATVIERIPVVDRSMRLYGISLPSNVSPEQYREAIYGLNLWNFAFIDPDSGNIIGLYLPNTWSNVPEYPAALGSYTLSLEAASLPEWFPVEIPAFDIPLHIVDNSRPHITVMFGDASFGFVSLMLTNAEMFADAQQIKLYYSTDKGESWHDVSEDFSGAIIDMMMLSVEPLTPETNYLFYAEITSGGEALKSNVLYFPNFISDLDVDFSYGGGDPDEDDFGDQGEEPPSGTIIPPPQDDPAPTPTPEPEDDPEPTPTPDPEDASDSTPTPKPEDNPEPTPTTKPQNTPAPTPTLKPQNTPEPTLTPELPAETEPETTNNNESADIDTSAPQQNDSSVSVSEESDTNTEKREIPVFVKVLLAFSALAVTGGGVAAAVYLWRRKGGH